LRTTPAKNPRTECGCQPVETMMPAMVAPPGRRSRTRTRACFEFARKRLHHRAMPISSRSMRRAGFITIFGSKWMALKGWAVTRGPSLNPADKRLAVHVEDHPLAYGTFEGTIPQGEYGGGTVMLSDRGTWTPTGDAARGYKKGRLDFELHGERLKGRWHLVRMQGSRRGDALGASLRKGWFRMIGTVVGNVTPTVIAVWRSLSHQLSRYPIRRQRHDIVVGCPSCRHVRAENRTWRSSNVTIGRQGRAYPLLQPGPLRGPLP
jgi:hypothetical protein